MIPVFAQLRHFKQTGPGKWIACCPAHKDKSPSLSIRETSDGKTLLHCFAGCAAAEICAALGIAVHDLFAGGGSYDPKLCKRSTPREIYNHEKLVLRIFNHDRQQGRTISATDHKRAALALSRTTKIERLWGGAP